MSVNLTLSAVIIRPMIVSVMSKCTVNMTAVYLQPQSKSISSLGIDGYSVKNFEEHSLSSEFVICAINGPITSDF
jgi:hypothetical protein